MFDAIPLIPPIPEALRLAAKQGTLIPFVGAGASRLGGCPGWADFADGAFRSFIRAGKLNLSQFEQIKHLSPRIKLSIALALQKEHPELSIEFRKILHPEHNPLKAQGERFYASLSKLAKTFVTTNFDTWLDEDIVLPDFNPGREADASKPPVRTPRTVIHKVEDFTYDNLKKRDAVFHLHGTMDHPDNMIMTTRHYIDHYANDRLGEDKKNENMVLTFLGDLFKLKNVLFVGYGLDELEILEYVILKARKDKGQKAPESKHFLLQGFFSHELELAQRLETYYLVDCGIQLLPYSRDHNDWEQLLEVMTDFARQIPASDPLVIQQLSEMSHLLDA
jgi:hypothetical protein